jgi:hypothetical protein
MKLLEMSGFMKWRSHLMPQACSSLLGSSPLAIQLKNPLFFLIWIST